MVRNTPCFTLVFDLCTHLALLIAFSPPDSIPTAWAGTLLTLALIIAAIVSKVNGVLTLHHATLVLK